MCDVSFVARGCCRLCRNESITVHMHDRSWHTRSPNIIRSKHDSNTFLGVILCAKRLKQMARMKNVLRSMEFFSWVAKHGPAAACV